MVMLVNASGVSRRAWGLIVLIREALDALPMGLVGPLPTFAEVP